MDTLIYRAEQLILDAVLKKRPQSPMLIKTIVRGARFHMLVIHTSEKRFSKAPTVVFWEYKAIVEGTLTCNVISSSTAPLKRVGEFNKQDFELIENMLQNLA